MREGTVGAVARLLDRLVPLDLAAEWDNVGLQVGDPDLPVQRIAVTLEVDSDVLAGARAGRADLIVSHHPLIFDPLRSVARSGRVGTLIHDLVAHNIGLYAAHTNLDASDVGPDATLARLLCLEEVRPIVRVADLLKLVVFVPVETLDKVRRALGDAGAGHIGEYSYCTFSVPGRGTFLPSPGTRPYVGEIGRLNEVEECRLETIAPRRLLPGLLDALISTHPYEEPAYDVYTLENRGNLGMGRLGALPQSISGRELARELAGLADCADLRFLGDPEQGIRRVAIACGAGSGMWRRAWDLGAEILVTGDLGYHTAEEILSVGMCAIDAGHAGSEAPFLGDFARALRQALANDGWNCEVIQLPAKSDPWMQLDCPPR